MACEPLARGFYGNSGFVCSRGTIKPKICDSCGKKRALRECDAHVMTSASDTCDRYICDHCTAHVEGFDVDLCPIHANQTPPPHECTVDRYPRAVRPDGVDHPCKGAIIYPHWLCLAHARLFDCWLREHDGWRKFYSKPDSEIGREEKRRAFREWMSQTRPTPAARGGGNG